VRTVCLVRAYAAAVEEIEEKVRRGEGLENWDKIMLAGLPSVLRAAEEALEEMGRVLGTCT